MKRFACGLAALIFAVVPLQGQSPPIFEIHDHERIVFIGGTLVEREQHYGHLETALRLAAAGREISLRNLGWSGDTVFGHARSYFGPPKEGFERLGKHLAEIKPTLLITCYGADLAFEGLRSLPEFISGYRELLDLARAQNPHVRIVIIAPPPLENLGPPLPDLTEANARLEAVRKALQEFATKQAATFVDSFEFMGGNQIERPTKPLTDNGVHYTDAGYQVWAAKVVESLGLPKVSGPPGEVASLRELIIKKDRLFFNRWRPANETYLYGFRKHEQGQNAAEIEKFDPLVRAHDRKIHELKSKILKESQKLP